MGIEKIVDNVLYQLGLTEPGLLSLSDTEVINDHGITMYSLYRLCIP